MLTPDCVENTRSHTLADIAYPQGFEMCASRQIASRLYPDELSLHLVLWAQAPIETSLVVECCDGCNNPVAAHLARGSKAPGKQVHHPGRNAAVQLCSEMLHTGL